MAIKKEMTSDGVKLRDTVTGKLAGSIPKGVNAPTPAPELSISSETNTDPWAAPDVNDLFLRFQNSSPGVYGADVDEEDFNLSVYRAEWLDKLPVQEQVAYLTGRTVPTGLGEDQAKYVYDALKRAAKRWDPKPVEPTDEQWQEYLSRTAERFADPENGFTDAERLDALARLKEVEREGKPDAMTFAVMDASVSRTWRARYALDEQARQIGAWIDADEWDVKEQITKFRNEYYEKLDAGEEIEISQQYVKSWARTSGTAPKDPATVYSHWKAENPELYLNPRTPKRFVALDLETTGISTKDSHIIEIGLVEYDAKGNKIGSWSQFVCPPPLPDGTISTGDEKVMSVHKIMPSDVIGQPSFTEVMPELRRRLEGATIIGHNLGFDTKHLRANLRKYAPEDSPELAATPWLGEADTLFHASRHMTGLENNKLMTVSHALGVSYTNGHRAEHDAEASGDVFFKIRAQLKRRQAKAIKAAQQHSE